MVIMASFLLASCKKEKIEITDIDGNVYHGVTIGNQIWMTENLRTTRYADGSAIPKVEEGTAWSALETNGEAYCWYDNNPSVNEDYGCLYTWAAATNGGSGSSANPSGVQGVCPDGWHLPSEEEWKELVFHLGGYFEAGEYLKEDGNIHWVRGNYHASNSSGFTALPGGSRSTVGTFYDLTNNAYFWTATDKTTESATSVGLVSDNGDVKIVGSAMKTGRSVRCVKD